MPSLAHCRRVLYVGRDYALLAALRYGLAGLDCMVVRHPADGLSTARLLIGSDIPYEVLLFDAVLVGATGAELARFALSLPNRAGTPTLIVKEADDTTAIAERVGRLLAGRD